MDFKHNVVEDDRLLEVANYLKSGKFNPRLSRAIVFVKSRKKVEECSLIMPDSLKGVFGPDCTFAEKVGAFHAGMDAEDRKDTYEKYERFNVISDPSQSSILDSRSSSPEEKVEPEPVILEPVKVEAVVKACPEGKELNPKTGRCVKVKTQKVKKTKKVEKQKACPEGKEINPKTGRCVKVKTKKEGRKK